VLDVGGKCYFHPRKVVQPAGATGWTTVTTWGGDTAWNDPSYTGVHLFSKEVDRNHNSWRIEFKNEVLRPGDRYIGTAYPIDCAAMNQTFEVRSCDSAGAASEVDYNAAAHSDPICHL
jgi:hypothetical protein